VNSNLHTFQTVVEGLVLLGGVLLWRSQRLRRLPSPWWGVVLTVYFVVGMFLIGALMEMSGR
jgi:hypothetical protein